MDTLINAIDQFTTKDVELKKLVTDCLTRLADDIEEAGLVHSSVMEILFEGLQEYLDENYPVSDDDDDEEEVDLDDDDLDELRDVDDEDES